MVKFVCGCYVRTVGAMYISSREGTFNVSSDKSRRAVSELCGISSVFLFHSPFSSCWIGENVRARDKSFSVSQVSVLWRDTMDKTRKNRKTHVKGSGDVWETRNERERILLPCLTKVWLVGSGKG